MIFVDFDEVVEGGEGDGGFVLWCCILVDFVYDDEGVGGGLVEDGGGFEYFDYEGGLGGVEVV